jgi:GNAT superfamily N-acetyltransferase
MIWQITKNHYNAAIEHIENHNINHTPTLWQALRLTISDLILNKTIYIKKHKSHLVYEIVINPTLGIRVANIIRVYVPKEHRGKGIASLMIDKIPEKTIISGKGKEHEEIARLYRVRANF